MRGVPNNEVVHREADSSNNTDSSDPYLNGDHKDHITTSSEATAAEFDHGPSTSSGNRGEPLKAVLDATEAQYIDERTNKQMSDIEAEVCLSGTSGSSLNSLVRLPVIAGRLRSDQ